MLRRHALRLRGSQRATSFRVATLSAQKQHTPSAPQIRDTNTLSIAHHTQTASTKKPHRSEALPVMTLRLQLPHVSGQGIDIVSMHWAYPRGRWAATEARLTRHSFTKKARTRRARRGHNGHYIRFHLAASQNVNLAPYVLATHAQRGRRLMIYRAGPLIPAHVAPQTSSRGS